MNFEEVIGWGDRSWNNDVTGVAVDSQDRVYVLQRGNDPVTVFAPDGTILESWGSGYFSDRPHMISIGEDGRIYVADDGGHRIYVFSQTGHLLETIGSDTPSITGYDAEAATAEIALDRVEGGPPFNRPTKAAPCRNGELFVSDGYRNCRVHRYSADRQLIRSWGGTGPREGHFVIPHSVAIDNEGRVFICDRENDRIQIFSSDGLLLNVWNDTQRPTDVAFDWRGNVYVTELPRGPKDLKSWRLGRAQHELPGRVTVRSSTGSIITQVTCPDVEFPAPHAIAVDSKGAIYVAEVPQSFANYTGKPHRVHRCLRKFKPC